MGGNTDTVSSEAQCRSKKDAFHGPPRLTEMERDRFHSGHSEVRLLCTGVAVCLAEAHSVLLHDTLNFVGFKHWS